MYITLLFPCDDICRNMTYFTYLSGEGKSYSTIHRIDCGYKYIIVTNIVLFVSDLLNWIAYIYCEYYTSWLIDLPNTECFDHNSIMHMFVQMIGFRANFISLHWIINMFNRKVLIH